MKDNPHGERRFVPPMVEVSRRAVARTIAGGGLVAVLLAAGSRTDALAQATPSADNAGPSKYTLKGGEIEIVVVPAVTGGAARIDYRDATRSLTFTGDELTTEHSPALGRLVSFAVEYVADGYNRYLTLLVPDVNPDENGLDVPIQTVAIVTTHWTSIGGPALVQGALQTYEVVALDGVAEFTPA